LRSIVLAGALVLALTGALALLRRTLLAGRSVERARTWDCGYAQPTASMQYTASSYVQPATVFFAALLRSHRRVAAPAGLFPGEASFATETPDLCEEALYRPAFRLVGRAAGRLRWLQHGKSHIYVLYISITILVLLIWYLGLAKWW